MGEAEKLLEGSVIALHYVITGWGIVAAKEKWKCIHKVFNSCIFSRSEYSL
jgi:hypothetical protein